MLFFASGSLAVALVISSTVDTENILEQVLAEILGEDLLANGGI